MGYSLIVKNRATNVCINRPFWPVHLIFHLRGQQLHLMPLERPDPFIISTHSTVRLNTTEYQDQALTLCGSAVPFWEPPKPIWMERWKWENHLKDKRRPNTLKDIKKGASLTSLWAEAASHVFITFYSSPTVLPERWCCKILFRIRGVVMRLPQPI